MEILHCDTHFVRIEQTLKRLFGDPHPERFSPRPGELKKRLKRPSALKQHQLEKLCGVPQPRISQMANHPELQFLAVEWYALSTALQCEIHEIAETPPYVAAVLTADILDRMAPQVLDVVNVRTLLRRNCRVDLRTFYYRTRLSQSVGKKTVIREVNCLSDLGPGPVVVHGLAGQGKSIFLRYLTAQAMESRESLPLFFELRNLRGKPIKQAIIDRLASLNFPSDESTLTGLFSSGSVSLLFDAYDELDIEQQGSFVRELMELMERYPQLHCIVSARPNPGVQHFSFRVYDIAALKSQDIPNVIGCYLGTEEAAHLISRLQETPLHLDGILTSPLMVALLIVRFQYAESIPDSAVEFYQDLLDVLLRRHNNSDGGLKRAIRSGLSGSQLERFFEALCFLVAENYSSWDMIVKKWNGTAELALEMIDCKAVEHSPLFDIVEITNLIIEEDGGRLCFVHRTIGEYFAAAFVASASSRKAEMFYGRLLNEGLWTRWQGTLDFLFRIDRLRSMEYFLIPDIQRCRPFSRAVMLSQCALDKSNSPDSPDGRLIDEQRYCLNPLYLWYLDDITDDILHEHADRLRIKLARYEEEVARARRMDGPFET